MNRRDFLATAAAAPLVLAEVENGFQSLFDGRTLSGWVIEEGPESAFYVEEGDLVASPASQYPAWLRSTSSFENFDFRCEFFVRGWIDGGVYIHAPLHGRPGWNGMQINIFHRRDEVPRSNSMGPFFRWSRPRW